MGKAKVIVTIAVLLIDAMLLNDIRGIAKVVFSDSRELSKERSEISGVGANMRPGDWLLFVMDDGTKGGLRFDHVTYFKAEYRLWIGNSPNVLMHRCLFFFWFWDPWYLDLNNTTSIICFPETDEALFVWTPPFSLNFARTRFVKVAVYTGDQPINEELFQSDTLLWQSVDHSFRM